MVEKNSSNIDKEVIKAARRAYRKKWYQDHREQARMYQDRWVVKKARELGLIPNEEGDN